jgi:hypothetical protein
MKRFDRLSANGEGRGPRLPIASTPAGTAPSPPTAAPRPPAARAYPACEPLEERFGDLECTRLAALRRLLSLS